MEVQSMAKEEIAREKGIYRVTIVGSVVNFLLLLFKFLAGIVGHSAAMLATHCLTLLQILLLSYLCASRPSRRMRGMITGTANMKRWQPPLSV